MIIGVSGHQDLGASAQANWVRNCIHDELAKRNFTRGISSLAEGADQLFAQIVLDFGKLLDVIVPCNNYESAFRTAAVAAEFLRLKQKASRCVVLDFDVPSEEAFFAAGQRVVELSDLLFAVWNGKSAAGLGGTGDIVKHALKRRIPVLQINPISMTTQLLDTL